MSFYNYQEEETNNVTKKIHKLLTDNEHKKVIEFYNSISDDEKTGEQTRCAVASLILEQRMDEAKELLDKWESCGKDDVEWNTQYGWIYYLKKDYKSAIVFFNKIEELKPWGSYMLEYLKECNEKIGNKEEVYRLKKRIFEIQTISDKGRYTKEEYYKNK
ncbi:MAG: hypothetical protein KGV59_00705 [Tenacibaculum sp.]|nr:hypothetical protein [Tenacibaculum sp.]